MKTKNKEKQIENSQEVYYHGTDISGINAIIKSRLIGVGYFDGIGVYLTKDIEQAKNHGQYILVFKNIQPDKLETDDVNDGIFHRGHIDLSSVSKIISDIHDKRVIKDLIERANGNKKKMWGYYLSELEDLSIQNYKTT